MTDIFRKVKSMFSNLKSLISSKGDEEADPYDKLIERFSSDKPLDVNELEEIKTLCKKITNEEGQSIVDRNFDILKELMFERIVDASCKSQVTVNDKKIKNKTDYKEFIKKEYKRMIRKDPDDDKKEVKRIKTNTHSYHNEVSWGILPEKWRVARENAPVDVVEFALNNDDENKGPVLFIGDVPSEEESNYFNEEYLTNLYKKDKPNVIICDLYNPQTNCRKCIRYEFNQEKIKNLREEHERQKNKEDELFDRIKDNLGGEMGFTDKIIKKTSNLEDKVWLSFLFNKDFKFSELSEGEKNLFFTKLKKSGVLCMEALEKGTDSVLNTKTKEFATKKELFDIKENTGLFIEGNILNENKTEHFTSGLLSSDNEPQTMAPKLFDLNKEIKEEEKKPLFNFGQNKDEDLKDDDLKDDDKEPFSLPPAGEGLKTKEETKQTEKPFGSFSLPPVGEGLKTKEETKQTEKPFGSFPLPPAGEGLKTKEETKQTVSPFGSFPLPPVDLNKSIPQINKTDAPVSLNLPPPVFNLGGGDNLKKFEINTNSPSEKPKDPVKIPENWHFFPKYPLETNKDSSINPPVSNGTHPPVFPKKEGQSVLSPSSSFNFSIKKDQNVAPSLSSFLPVNNDKNNLNTSTGSFSFTPSVNSFPLPPTNTFSPVTAPSFSSGPSKRKMGGLGQTAPSLSPFGSTQQPSTNQLPTFNIGQSMLQTPPLNNNPELNKIIATNQINTPFLGEVANPFETANPLQHSTNNNLTFVDNTFKYNDIFNKDSQNLFLKSKSMFDDLIFEGEKKEEQQSSVRYSNKKEENNNSSIFGSNIFGNDNDPWKK